MTPEPPKKKPALPFEQAVEALLQRYGFVDWAVVVRRPDNETRAWWVAGDEKDQAADRARAMVLFGEMGALQDTILLTQRKRLAPPRQN